MHHIIWALHKGFMDNNALYTPYFMSNNFFNGCTSVTVDTTHTLN